MSDGKNNSGLSSSDLETFLKRLGIPVAGTTTSLALALDFEIKASAYSGRDVTTDINKRYGVSSLHTFGNWQSDTTVWSTKWFRLGSVSLTLISRGVTL